MKNIDLRKVLRYVVNLLALVAAVLVLPAFGALVPVSWLPQIAGIVAVINVVLSFIRQIGAGEPLVTKTF